jgi:hypothetical protein
LETRAFEKFPNREGLCSSIGESLGAASQILKALADKEGKEIMSHAELWRAFSCNKELRYLWRTTKALHQTFYEN